MQSHNRFFLNGVDNRMDLYNSITKSVILPLEKKVELLIDFVSLMLLDLGKLEVKNKEMEERLKCLESEKSKTG